MANSKVSMKLLIDNSKVRRVLFAEASKDCVDFLFHILSLPVATVIRLLRAEGMKGSLPNLYKSLEDLNDTYLLPNHSKDAFLKPVVPVSTSTLPLLALPAAPTTQKNFYRCSGCNNNSYNSSYKHVSDDPRATCPSCSRVMNISVAYVDPPATEVASKEGGLVKGVVTYMVMDDLKIKPMSTISSITMLNKFNVKEVGSLEEKVVDLGMNEAIKLLKTSFETNNVLTTIFC
ncbi:hypothetical protein SASPL_101023 [Salvia splendens]|uniref:DUF674 domain-containing protein n=1 Tax=Salvia splendens TaxID=180675 RepID=A0A8X9ADM5_SALSN|nr:uncharacterized protein LOC121789828 [Salvia splendens]KAG6436139.1 hypothetical protein SASPL_101023 [Salvia splendens]